MDLKQLQTFIAVADAGGFSRAAAQIDVTQSALSRQIALLELELHARLFVRTGRGVSLTEAGGALLRNARTMIELADRTKNEVRDLSSSPGGRITVGLPPRVGAIIAAQLVQSFRKTFPNALLTLFEGMSHHLRESLVAGRIDVALMFDPPPAPRIMYETLCVENMVLVGPPNGKRLPKRGSLRGLANFPLILASGSHTIRQVVDAATIQRQIALNIIAEVDSVRGLLSLVADGAGYSVVPQTAVSAALLKKGLQMCPIGVPALSSNLVLAIPQAGASSRLLNGTVQLLRQINFRELAINAELASTL